MNTTKYAKPFFTCDEDEVVIACAKLHQVYDSIMQSAKNHTHPEGRGTCITLDLENSMFYTVFAYFEKFVDGENGWMVSVWDKSRNSEADIKRTVAKIKFEYQMRSKCHGQG